MARDSAQGQLAQARDALGRGKLRAAVRHAWSATQAAYDAADAATLSDVERLAVALEERAEGKTADEARTLARYTAELRTQVEAGVKPSGLIAGLFRSRSRSRTKRCPDCAEEIKVEARVCRFCGYRYPE